MTATLKKAFLKASRLPKAAQEELAKQIISNIDADLEWDKTLAKSERLLEKMAAKAKLSRKGLSMNRLYIPK